MDLLSGKSHTLALESTKRLRTLAVSPTKDAMVAIAEDGKAMLFNLPRNKVLHHFSFKHAVRAAKFSADGKFLAVAAGRLLQIWNMPFEGKSFAPFKLVRTFGGATSEVLCLDWNKSGTEIVQGSEDSVARVFSLSPDIGVEGKFQATSLTSHRDSVMGAFFCKGEEYICSVARDAVAFLWVRKGLVTKGALSSEQAKWSIGGDVEPHKVDMDN